jgi:exodeoxyribonuclease VII large subunit
VSQPSFDFGADEAALDDPANPTFSVAELAEAINAALRRRFDDGIWVRGEIQGWNKSAAGHIYFNLVDIDSDTGARATVRVAFFAGVQHGPRERFRRAGLKLGDGLRVRIHGTLDFFAGNGSLTFKMTDIDPRFTLGELAMQRNEIVRRLVAAGLIDANRRRPLAMVPLRVGVVTSAGSAAWHDFRDELARSGIGFELRLVDVRVQGDWAVEMVTSAVRTLSARADLDVIVVIRGGGSRGDLATFDAEPVAKAIAESPIPVFTGLGHEIDRSIADEVAHTAWKTPTACAGALVERVNAFRRRADEQWAAICRRADMHVADAGRGLHERAHRIGQRTVAAVERSDERLATRRERLAGTARRRLADADRLVGGAAAVLGRRPAAVLEAAARRVEVAEARVRAADPAVALARGWSITRTAAGEVVRSVGDVMVGDVVHTLVADGTITSTVGGTVGSPVEPAASRAREQDPP